jgi:dTDP-glucose pyrophosphorylase
MLKGRIISPSTTVLQALKKMDREDNKLLIVLDNQRFEGLLSAGDIQRAIIQNKPLSLSVNKIIRKNIRVASPNDSLEDIKRMMFDYRMELCPVVSVNNEILKVYFWEDVFNEKPQPSETFNLPVVIMAGGLGSRLKPLTNVLPKPLIPINDKTMLEEIFERFYFHGCDHFYVFVNYKADLIKYYIGNQNLPYEIDFYTEEKPLGTVGGLSLVRSKINDTFFVSNCDILIEQDYSEILKYHRANKNEITIVAVLKHIPIPYGTIETGGNGKLVSLIEKPELTFKINSGMYICEPQIIDDVEEDSFFQITQLIEKVKQRGGTIGVFPVSEKSWIDIGIWSELFRLSKNVE